MTNTHWATAARTRSCRGRRVRFVIKCKQATAADTTAVTAPPPRQPAHLPPIQARAIKSKRSSKRNKSISDLTSSKNNKRTYLTRSSTKNKTIRNEAMPDVLSDLSEEVASNLSKCVDDDLTSSKKNTRTYLTRSSTKNKTIPNEVIPESKQDVWSELSEEVASNLSKCVVSLALSNGCKVLFTCSGIAVQSEGHVIRFLTSASLDKALNNERKHHDNLKVEVRHEDHVVIGFLGEYDDEVASVIVKNFPGLQTVYFGDLLVYPPYGNVVSVGRDISGKLITESGILDCDLSGSIPSPMATTCKISKAFEGGPLFDCDGNFLGMNLSFWSEGTSFMPKFRLIEKLWTCCTSLEHFKFPKEVRVEESSSGKMPNYHQVHDLESLGYPEPPKSMLNDGIVLANSFEEPFGDIFGEGVWSELSETVASNIHDNIVALASFNGEKRFFACTGCLIEWNGCTTILTAASLIRDHFPENKIVNNLKIQVLLPNKKLAEGILQHYNLHYNIALVSVNDFCANQPVKIQHRWRDNRELLAVGCIYKSRKLMAAKGRPFCTMVTHECRYLAYTKCQITKAGIGGPLFDFDGKFVGMNFYDKYSGGSPFLSWDAILLVLDYFKTKQTVAEAGHDGYASRGIDWTMDGDHSSSTNRWFVPLPFWSYPDDVERRSRDMQPDREVIIPLDHVLIYSVE